MDRSCEQFFPRPRLSVDKHGRVGWGDLFNLSECRQKRGAIADNFIEVVLGADLLLQINVLFF